MIGLVIKGSLLLKEDIMIKNCDSCDKKFNIFNEGRATELDSVWCGECLIIELNNRKNKGDK